MKKFAWRLLTSAVLLSGIAVILFLTPPLAFALLVTAFIAAALFEFFNLLKEQEVPIFRTFGIAIGILVPLIVYQGHGATESNEILFLVLACLFLFLIQFFRKHDSQALVGISLTLFGVLYISWFLSFFVKIRFLSEGPILIAYLVAVTKAADIGAYAIGSLFGRHSLIPHISPKKSIEGTIGGLVLSALVSLALSSTLPVSFSIIHALVLGFLIGVLGQIGDLSESLMKRFCQAKDSSGVLPGMGGVLDAVDSVIFTAPIFYFYIRMYL